MTEIDPSELQELHHALRDAVVVPDGDTPPQPVTDWRSDWPRLADLGLAGLAVAEHAGGSGDRADAAAVAASVLGAALHGTPFPAIAAAASVLADTTSGDVADLLADVLAGKRVCGFAPYEEATGRAHAVLGADACDALVLVDQSSGAVALATGPGSWTTTAAGLGTFETTRSVHELRVDSRCVVPVPGSAAGALQLYRLLLAADTLGGLERSLERTISYSSTRTAFGRPIGGFQAVQHRLVEHSTRVRGMRLAVTEAAHQLTLGAPTAPRAALLAEIAVGGHAVRVLHDLVQLTGGIGFTWEHGLHHFERRALLNGHLAGNPRRATAELAVAEGWTR